MQDPSTRSVLVVDDDEDLSTLVASVLSDEGYSVEVASNGAEALDAITRAIPDLILLDMKMPVMDGTEFTRRFRSQFDLNTPIVILTASVDGGLRADEVGASDWVGKPFDLTDLLDAVNRNLRK